MNYTPGDKLRHVLIAAVAAGFIISGIVKAVASWLGFNVAPYWWLALGTSFLLSIQWSISWTRDRARKQVLGELEKGKDESPTRHDVH